MWGRWTPTWNAQGFTQSHFEDRSRCWTCGYRHGLLILTWNAQGFTQSCFEERSKLWIFEEPEQNLNQFIFKVRVRSGTLVAIHTPVKIVEDRTRFSNGGLVNVLNLKYI